ncbi:terpene synthase family protein [Spirillospora albida]|uniref:terpene synthase family protein n=1 Tax=Spirillospora albida TaxID=58123 RepID=UPI00068D3188|nr:hypothetical protein [Spirillospora albida]
MTETIAGSGVLRTGAHRSPGFAERPWGDDAHPPLYSPGPVRTDDALAAEVGRRLAAWERENGLPAGRGEPALGRLAVLAHPGTDDPDLLLLAAQFCTAWRALAARPGDPAARLAALPAALDGPPPADRYAREPEEAVAADPALRALGSAVAHLRGHATPSQVMRVRSATFQLAASGAAEPTGAPPPVWRRLTALRLAFPAPVLIDVVDGYRLDADLFADPRVQRALVCAGTAAGLVHDLHAAERDPAHGGAVRLIAAEEGHPPPDAIRAAVALHNGLVRDFEDARRRLAAALPSAELRRFLHGVQGWLGGFTEWHRSGGARPRA